ncbi:MAG TPA: hypothetical protein VGR57_19775, partial [Ktedonobacterales bacterium]|nr:hypothetical protein [Ktedonobacterales bacterium]
TSWATDQSLADYGGSAFAVVAAAIAWGCQVMALIIVALPRQVTTQQQALGDTLRALIARRDEALTPSVVLQPRRMAPIQPGSVTELRPFQELPSRQSAIWAMALLAMFFGTTIIGASAITTIDHNVASDAVLIQALGIAGSLILGGILLWQTLRSTRGTHTRLALDDEGIHFHQRRVSGERRIAWGEIKTVTQIVSAPLINRFAENALEGRVQPGSTTYYIDDGTRVFAWYVANAANEKEYRASEDLLRYVVARTGLPLRDATGLASDLRALSLPRARALLTERTPTDPANPLLAALRDAVGQLPPARRAAPAKITAVSVLLVALAVPNLALPVAAQRLDQAQSRFDANYYATVRASRPIYATNFAYNDGSWPESMPKVTEDTAYLFAGGAYHLAGTRAGRTAISMYWAKLKDGAVEVTVSQREQSPPLGFTGEDGAGVLFHANGLNVDYTSFLVFLVESDGHWAMWRYSYVSGVSSKSWNELDAGYSAAINKGYGTRNTIFYLQRGRQITVRVNGKQVMDDTFPESEYPSFPIEGYAGLYSNESALDTAFTEFTLYHLPSPPTFWSALGINLALPNSHPHGGG